MEKLNNSGVIALNKPVKAGQAPKTVVVVGVSNSGASLMAEVLSSLGIYFNSEPGKPAYQDGELTRAMEARNAQGFQKLIKQRSANHEHWGWKLPSSFDALKNLLPMGDERGKWTWKRTSSAESLNGILSQLRNPHLIVMLRNPLAIVQQNSTPENGDELHFLERSLDIQDRTLLFLKQCKTPTLLVPYEDLAGKREQIITRVTEFLNLSADQAKEASRRIASGQVQSLGNATAPDIKSQLLISSKHVIHGQVKLAGQGDKPLKLRLKIETPGTDPARTSPLQSTDLPLDLKPLLRTKGMHRVTIEEPASNMALANSPFLLYHGQPKQKPSKLFFAHVPKTAGTSFRLMLEKLFTDEEIFPNKHEIKENGGYPPLTNINHLSFARLESLKLINGHYTSAAYQALPYRLNVAIFVRKPQDRLLSNLRHFKALDPACADMSLEEVFLARRKHLEHLQIRFVDERLTKDPGFESMDRSTFEQRIQAALQNIRFIGITEEFNDSIKLFQKEFKIKLPKPIRANERRSNDPVTPSLKLLIEQATEREDWFYELVVKEFQKRLNA